MMKWHSECVCQHARVSECVCQRLCVCVWWKGGALNRGPSSPDLKRHSFIIANLPNINTRASTQSLSQGQRGDPPMTGDEGPHECSRVRASGCLTVCVRKKFTDCYRSTYQLHNSCLWDFYRLVKKRMCVCLWLYFPVLLGKSGSIPGCDSTCETISSATTDN